ncbi:hypothetical protein A3B45_02095 [Candidatus Daviesbacteria bacterium RIFCSPLOWO2_01_FULL_39_12]|uniref:Uncharacterized protein n=1 Tax=Candidatus Daviesbacteria bacterium RIFCSPLOWO2_01_FULL_39_12 TaxID=1797785 RepID=A0A1F5KU26_9BACT|nr:MAG: hypothetical protein A3D79_01515 [Candidatus Daviesbacteria bacterium RIFCSPHIGHO2_02_FULL_39_8]OGE44438.1 MAG: hypothetical protein A3B45_02095 [Candidatus Daviesbacteria bacterium RIFCSPLOWO2_01_FULL_39_12]
MSLNPELEKIISPIDPPQKIGRERFIGLGLELIGSSIMLTGKVIDHDLVFLGGLVALVAGIRILFSQKR